MRQASDFVPVPDRAASKHSGQTAAVHSGSPIEKLDAALRSAWLTSLDAGGSAALEQLAARRVPVSAKAGEIGIIVRPTEPATADGLESALRAAGFTVVRPGPGTVKVSAAPDRLEDLASLPEVGTVRTLRPPRLKNTVTTEGVAVALAAPWHAAGERGQGVSVAVVDTAFADLGTLKAQGEIPPAALEINYTSEAMSSGDNPHGCGAAEIVHDMAPGAALHLVKIDDATDLAGVTAYCIAQGIDIVSCSLGWDALNFHDGVAYENGYTTAAQHPVRAVDDAAAAGVLWVTAAGNEQMRHARAGWRDWNGDRYLDWNAANFGLNTLWKDGSTWIPAGVFIDLYLTWNQWPLTDDDFDLELYRDTGSGWQRVDVSDYVQDGTPGSYPEEEIFYETHVAGEYAVGVYRYDASAAPTFILRCYGVDEPQYYSFDESLTPVGGSLSIPGDAAGSFTVGAIDHLNYAAGPIEWFSSLGPNNRGYTGGTALTKPDLCGPTWVSCVSYGTEGFSGTSAATPHVAGLAALAKGAYPEMTAADLRQFLEANALDLGAPGKDNTYGAGAARVPAPPLPGIVALDHLPGVGLVIQWASKAEHHYAVHRAEDLAEGFATLQGGIPATPPMNTYTGQAVSAPSAFWSVTGE